MHIRIMTCKTVKPRNLMWQNIMSSIKNQASLLFILYYFFILESQSLVEYIL